MLPPSLIPDSLLRSSGRLPRDDTIAALTADLRWCAEKRLPSPIQRYLLWRQTLRRWNSVQGEERHCNDQPWCQSVPTTIGGLKLISRVLFPLAVVSPPASSVIESQSQSKALALKASEHSSSYKALPVHLSPAYASVDCSLAGRIGHQTFKRRGHGRRGRW